MACEGDFEGTLGSLFVYDGDFVATLGSLGGHFLYLRAALGALWGHFGVTLGRVLVSVGDLASLDGHFAIIVESLWVCKGPFPKNIHFLHRFQ